MADQSDVMDALVAMAFAACYPGGPNTPSVTGKIIHVGEGWPLVEDLNAALANDQTVVSVYMVPGSYTVEPQVFDWISHVVVAPIHGLSVVVDDDQATFMGTANKGEYATLIVDTITFSYAATTAATAQQMAAALLKLASHDFPDATRSGPVLTFPSSHEIVARIGAPGLIGRKIHRQAHQFQITTWAPSAADRTQIGKLVDIAMKRPVRISMPDTSVAIIKPRDTRISDREENRALYRRDLILEVMFDTVDLVTGYEVTATPFKFRVATNNTAN